MATKILRLPKVIERTGKRKTAIYIGMETGDFPKCFSIGGRAVGWLEEEIEQWIKERAESRNAA